MRLVFDKDVLENALESSCSIASKPTFAVLNNVLVKVKDNTCVFYATDLTDFLHLRVPMISGDDGEFLLNGKTALPLIKTLPKGEVVLETEKSCAVLKSGKFKANIPMADRGEFPAIQTAEVDFGLKFKFIDLKNALLFVSPFVSTDMSREIFCGVNFNYVLRENEETKQKESLVTLCATDGHRLAKIDIVAEDNHADDPIKDGVIISAKAINTITKYFSQEQDITFSIKDNKKAIFKSETVTLITSLINGTFPDFSCIIPQTTKNAIVDKTDLMSALKRCSLINPKNLLAKIEVSNNNINVMTTSAENGSMSEDVECRFEGNNTQLGLNSKYLEQALAAVDDNFAVLCFNDNDSPVKLISEANFDAKDDGMLSIIMPMQI